MDTPECEYSEPLRKSQEWFKHLMGETHAVLKPLGFRKDGKAKWVAKRPEAIFTAGFQKSASTKANYLKWFFWRLTECTSYCIREDFELPEFRGKTAVWGGRVYDPAGPVRKELWDLVKIRYPEVPVPTGPYRQEAWEIASEDEAEPTIARFVRELRTVVLPEMEHAASPEGMVANWEMLRDSGINLSVGEVELLRIGKELVAQREIENR